MKYIWTFWCRWFGHKPLRKEIVTESVGLMDIEDPAVDHVGVIKIATEAFVCRRCGQALNGIEFMNGNTQRADYAAAIAGKGNCGQEMTLTPDDLKQIEQAMKNFPSILAEKNSASIFSYSPFHRKPLNGIQNAPREWPEALVANILGGEIVEIRVRGEEVCKYVSEVNAVVIIREDRVAVAMSELPPSSKDLEALGNKPEDETLR